MTDLAAPWRAGRRALPVTASQAIEYALAGDDFEAVTPAEVMPLRALAAGFADDLRVREDRS